MSRYNVTRIVAGIKHLLRGNIQQFRCSKKGVRSRFHSAAFGIATQNKVEVPAKVKTIDERVCELDIFIGKNAGHHALGTQLIKQVSDPVKGKRGLGKIALIIGQEFSLESGKVRIFRRDGERGSDQSWGPFAGHGAEHFVG